MFHSLRGLLAACLVGSVSAGGAYRCVFIHGVGISTSFPSDTFDASGYWGGLQRISEYTPYCASRHFLHQETERRGWDDRGLQNATCELAVGGEVGDGTIRNTIVITHSMGNLFFAEALRRNTCSLDTNTSKWISIQAPWQGSKAAAWVEKICSNETSSTVLRWLAKELSYCDPDVPGKVFRSYETLRPDFPGLRDLLAVAQPRVHASLCGSSPLGLVSQWSAALEAFSAEVGFGEANDGIVPSTSCMLPGGAYREHYSAPFYLASVNHLDGTCRLGNGLLDIDSRRPGDWLLSVIPAPSIAEVVLV
jgi:hypothetical protein